MSRFSVIIPTHQRRELVTRNVESLKHQVKRDFEVIVVVDGSNDGTGAALRQLEVPFALTVLEQPHRGRAAALRAGVSAAAGELFLFLDDDMEADPGLLAEHERAHEQGADVVIGDLPLHPDSPCNLVSWLVGQWARTRRERLSVAGAELGPHELLTGQLSISRADYQRIGGFDPSFTRGGMFGGEDTDLAYRMTMAGLRSVFNPDAISYQYYDVDPADYLKRAGEAGRSSHELLLKHPDQGDRFGRVEGFRRRRHRLLLGAFILAPEPIVVVLRGAVAALVRTGHLGPRLRTLFFAVRNMERLRGIRLARAATATGRAVVLAYHAIADLHDVPILREYSVAPDLFARQLDALASQGWRFIDVDQLLAALAGHSSLPPRALLVTFDDGYKDFITSALPVLRARGIPAVVFAVAGYVGGQNEWDRAIGAGVVELMDADELRLIAADGVEVGSHSVTHPSLARLERVELEAEARESAARLEALGLPRPKVLAYPYGERPPMAGPLLRGAGYEAAFTVSPGVVFRGADPYGLPRVQVGPADTPAKLRLKVISAGWPTPLRRRLLRWTKTRG